MINPNWSLQSACPLFEDVTVSCCLNTLMNYSSSISAPKRSAPSYITPATHKQRRYALTHIKTLVWTQIKTFVCVLNPRFLQDCAFSYKWHNLMQMCTQIGMHHMHPYLHPRHLNSVNVKYYMEEHVVYTSDNRETCSLHAVYWKKKKWEKARQHTHTHTHQSWYV